MDQIKFTVLRDQADDMRGLLRRHLPNGISFAERRSFWLWVAFTVTGPADALRKVQIALDDTAAAQAALDAW